MVTVLITGVGGASGIGAIRSLRAETSHEVIGVDMNPAAAGIQLADAGTSVPAAGDKEWPDAMADVVERFDVSVVIPTVDEELSELPALSRAISDEVSIVAPRQDVIDTAIDKYRTTKRLRKAGHDVPRTWLASEVDCVESEAFPLVLKPRQGRGSRGFHRLDNRDQLSDCLQRVKYEPKELIVQELLVGDEYTTSVVGTTDNRLLGVVPKEAVEKEGSTTIGATREAPAVANSCRAIFETLQPCGPLNIQQLLDEAGTPHTIEINPRFSSTSCLTVAAGFDEFDLLIRDALGKPVTGPDDYVRDRYLLRYDDHVFVDDEDFEQ